MPFLLKLEGFVRLDDVEYGPDSPDFVFRHADKIIGVELTISLPKVFPSGGFAQKADFKTWKIESDGRGNESGGGGIDCGGAWNESGGLPEVLHPGQIDFAPAGEDAAV